MWTSEIFCILFSLVTANDLPETAGHICHFFHEKGGYKKK
jgi:hypothetical protein